MVWTAKYLPFGGVETSTGTPIALRFPGQWYQSESGLNQNWMRDYDPTTGRYLQADPLGLVDGASVYGYALQNPGRYVDPTGEDALDVLLGSSFGRRAIALGGTAAIGDGPFPAGDAIGLCIIGAAIVYCGLGGELCSVSAEDACDEEYNNEMDACNLEYGGCLRLVELGIMRKHQCDTERAIYAKRAFQKYQQCRGL